MRINWRKFRELLLYMGVWWVTIATWTFLIVANLTLTLRIIVGVIAVLLTLIFLVVVSGSLERRC